MTQSCAHASYTAPTLARALDHTSLSARSASLKAKVAALRQFSTAIDTEQGSTGRGLVGDSAMTITDRLWRHVQRTQLSKPAFSPIQTFCDPRFQAISAEANTEILEEYGDLGMSY